MNREPQTNKGDTMKAYRMIGWSGMYDLQDDNQDNLIRNASKHQGGFTLWAWSGKQWKKVENFIF